MLPAKTSRITGLKKLMQMENLICEGIHSDAVAHREIALGQLRAQSWRPTALWRQLKRPRTNN